MKKFVILKTLYILGFIFLFQNTLSAQTEYNFHLQKDNHYNAPRTLPSSYQSRTQSVLWSNDFSNANDWIRTSNTGNNDRWVIRTAGPAGARAIPTINSSTAANGFALFDSDSLCSNNQIANLTYASSINLTGHPNVWIEFQQQYRRFFDSTFVFVSVDSINWTRFVVNDDLWNNDFCEGNGQRVRLDISAAAGNQPKVYLRFQFYSPSSMGSQAGCGYAWMIDDVRIFDKPKNDLVLKSMDIIQGSRNSIWGNVFYPIISIDNFPKQTFAGTFTNAGIAPQQNTRFIAYITKNGATRYTKTRVLGTFNPNQTSFYHLTSPIFYPTYPDTGVYNFNLQMASDSTDALPDDNQFVRKVIIDNSQNSSAYFPPYDSMMKRRSSFGTNISPATQDGIRLTSLITCFNDQGIDTISVFLAPGTIPGGDIIVSVLDTTGLLSNYPNSLNNPSAFPLRAISNTHTITSADTARHMAIIAIPDVTLAGNNQIVGKDLSANKGYFLCAELYSNGGQNPIYLVDDRTVKNPEWSSLTFVPATGSTPAKWYTNGNNYALRVNMRTLGCFINFGPPTDLALTKITSPVNGAPVYDSAQVSFWLKNVGIRTAYIENVAFALDTCSPVLQSFSRTIPIGDSAQFTFSKACVPLQNGLQTLLVYINGYQGDTTYYNDTVQVQINGSVYVNELPSFVQKVYPNPASSQLFIEVRSEEATLHAQLIDLNGRILFDSPLIRENERFSLPVDALPHGLYQLRLWDQTRVQNVKVMIGR